MWILFRCQYPFAVKVFAGGVNAVSGASKKSGGDGKHGNKGSQAGPPNQDYLVPPHQLWLDGIVREDGKISQFVASQVGSGYSVEAQITGQDSISGIQFEIAPRKNIQGQRPFHIVVMTLTGKKLSIHVCSSDTIDTLRVKSNTRKVYLLISRGSYSPVNSSEVVSYSLQIFVKSFVLMRETGRTLDEYGIEQVTMFHSKFLVRAN